MFSNRPLWGLLIFRKHHKYETQLGRITRELQFAAKCLRKIRGLSLLGDQYGKEHEFNAWTLTVNGDIKLCKGSLDPKPSHFQHCPWSRVAEASL